MKIRKKKWQTKTPYCDEVRTSMGKDLKYNYKNRAVSRNLDISVRRIPLTAQEIDNHPLLRSGSKQRFI